MVTLQSDSSNLFLIFFKVYIGMIVYSRYIWLLDMSFDKLSN